MRPIPMPPNIIDHFYRGGTRLAALRGVDQPHDRRPEEWLAATVHRAGEPGVGPSRTVDGVPLADLVAGDPSGWTGCQPVRPGDTGVLVKLLDADQRLPVHVHPTRPFAAAHLHDCYGKTEAWYVLAAEGADPAVWVGWSEPVAPAELARRVDTQDSDWLLDHLNKISVRPGDGIVVPAGTAHATGAGVFVVEVQEPSDYSILLEWSVTTATRDESHLDLGFDVVLGAVDHGALDEQALATLIRHTPPDRRSGVPIPVLSPAADPFFRLDIVAPDPHPGPVEVPAGFAVVIGLDGSGTLTGTDGTAATASSVDVTMGQVWAVPAGFGDWAVEGEVRLAVCRPAADWLGNVLDDPSS